MDRKHQFWSNQPVDVSSGNEMISKPGDISNDPQKLPAGFAFENLTSEKELSEFLEKNYVEDVHERHVLGYSARFLKWMFGCNRDRPGYNLVLRWNGDMVGFASAREHILVVRGVKERVVSINLLCVSRDLRGRRFAPVIIREITRRVNMNGIYQAIFTSGTDLFFNVSNAYYYHRPLNSTRLFSTGFCGNIQQKEVRRPRPGARLATEEDLFGIMRLFNEEARKHAFHEEMELEEISRCMQPVKDIVYTYVHESDGKVAEFGSFFILDTIEKSSGERIRGAYLYYRTSSRLLEIVSDLMYFAKSEGCDVFNCLNIMGNSMFLNDLGFERGTGLLKYYLYNWRTQEVDPNEVFLVLH